jgi:hypothetical protein
MFNVKDIAADASSHVDEKSMRVDYRWNVVLNIFGLLVRSTNKSRLGAIGEYGFQYFNDPHTYSREIVVVRVQDHS